MRVGMRRFDVRFFDDLNMRQRQARAPFRTCGFPLCIAVSARFRLFFCGGAHRIGLRGSRVRGALLLLLRGFRDW